ncbi:MAG: hypothetical protein V5A72_01795 [Candidatus Nanohaloarchaea archaeon]
MDSIGGVDEGFDTSNSFCNRPPEKIWGGKKPEMNTSAATSSKITLKHAAYHPVYLNLMISSEK